MKLSIVVPVYNAENSIHILLDSIIPASEDFEVICVNDGSTDNTVKAIEKYDDKRIRVVSKANEGTFKTWQMGVKMATGDYITIWDQDDYIESDYIGFIYDFITRVGADVLFTPYYVEKESGEKTICNIGIEEGLYRGKDYIDIKDQLLNGTVPYAKFTKVVKRELYLKQIANTYPGQLRDFEDWLTMIEIFGMANSVLICNKPYYHYIQYSNSVSKSTVSYSRNLESLIAILDYMKANSVDMIGEKNYNAVSVKALYIMVRKCLSIEEYDVIDRILNMQIFHNNVLHSNLGIIKRVVFYTKSTWALKLYKRVSGKTK